jgi:hypothetical protein
MPIAIGVRGHHGPEEETPGPELVVNRVPGDVPDEGEPEGRERESRALDHLPGNQPDEDERAERGEPRDTL